jgi:hypothetical protein
VLLCLCLRCTVLTSSVGIKQSTLFRMVVPYFQFHSRFDFEQDLIKNSV